MEWEFWWGGGYGPSIARGLRSTAQNAAYQYGHSGWTRAIKRGDAALMNEVAKIIWLSRTLWTRSPVTTFRMMPRMTLGRKRREAWIAESP